MRVFISSTVYDLIDVRAELAEQLKNLGVVPVLSDDKLSDFHVQHDVNSIETCLINVDSCDEVIFILDRRYGSILKDFDNGERSATHLEYLRAIDKKKRIRVYLRDHLLADYTIWKRNDKKYSNAMTWVLEKDIGLFKFLDEYTELEPDSKMSNWYDTFTSSIDLKAAIKKYFEKRTLPERLTQVIQNNNFPLIEAKVATTGHNANGKYVVKVSVTLSNIGGAPAFNFNVSWKQEEGGEKKDTIFSPNQSISKNLLWEVGSGVSEFEDFLIVKYESLIGISVCDTFHVNASTQNIGIYSYVEQVDRKFRHSSEVLINIEDD